MDKGTYDLIKATADEYIPDCLIFPDISLPDYDSIKVYNNIAAAAIIISILSAINLAMLFGFIMQKRKKTFTIFRITGCTRKKVIAYYLAECFSLIIPSYLVGTIAFEIVLKTILRKFYKYMSEVYILIFAIYLVISVISIIIVTLKSVNKSINEEWRSN